jgi:hypothetical protein
MFRSGFIRALRCRLARTLNRFIISLEWLSNDNRKAQASVRRQNVFLNPLVREDVHTLYAKNVKLSSLR